MDDKTTILTGLPLFAGLDPRAMEAIGTLARIESVPVGTVLIREGDAADVFYVIVSGTIRVERDGRFIRSLTDGGFLGEIALIEGGERTATATCASDCVLVELSSFEFGRVMARFPEVRARVDAALARRPTGDA
jgi:CRP-like cAMP-binding protein